MQSKNKDWKREKQYSPDGMSRQQAAEQMQISVHEAEVLEQQALRKLWIALKNDPEVRDYAANVLSIIPDDHERWTADAPAQFVPGQQLGLVFSSDLIQR